MKKKFAYIANDAKSYHQLNLAPHCVAKWEDGMRTDFAEPGSYEWWYFDSHLENGMTIVIIFFMKPIVDIQKKAKPFVFVDIDFSDGRKLHREYHGSMAEFTTSTDQCHVTIGKNYFKGDLDHYEIYFSDQDLTIDIKLTRQNESWRPDTGYQYFGKEQQHALAWVVPVPEGLVQATIDYQGKQSITTGTGYHDHNWGNSLMPKLIHHWYWARVKIGDYVIICALLTAEKAYHYDTIPMIMLAKNGKIIAQDANKLQLFQSDTQIHPTLEKPISNTLKFIYEQSNEKYEITLTRQRDIQAERLSDKGMQGFKKFLAKLIRYDGSYFRFIGKAQLEHYVDGNQVESLETNQAVWELMYFGKGKTP